jgi:hypothetical protein
MPMLHRDPWAESLYNRLMRAEGGVVHAWLLLILFIITTTKSYLGNYLLSMVGL